MTLVSLTFHLSLCLAKTKDKLFQGHEKNSNFGVTFGPFYQKLGKWNFSLKIKPVNFQHLTSHQAHK